MHVRLTKLITILLTKCHKHYSSTSNTIVSGAINIHTALHSGDVMNTINA